MSDLYRQSVINAWERAGSRLTLDEWVQTIAKRMPQFSNPEDIYAPVNLTVKIAGDIDDANGNVRIAVAPTDKEWYPKLIQGLEEMTGERHLTVQDYLGNPIEKMNARQLSFAGELDVVDKSTGKPVRLPEIVPPPLSMATDKNIRLKKWWNGLQDSLAKDVASRLQGKNMAEIAQATLEGGLIQKSVSNFLRDNTPGGLEWDTFIKTYGADNVAKNMDPEETMNFISKGILYNIREGLMANENMVRNYHATSGVGSEASLWKSTKNREATRYQKDFDMYRDIAEDALALPMVGTHMVNTILHGFLRVDTSLMRKRKKKQRVERPRQRYMSPDAEEFHPMATYLNKTYYPRHGTLPGHVMEGYTKNKSVAAAKSYVGNAAAALNVYHMLSGKSPKPSIKPQSKSKDFVGSSIPELVPIGSHVMPEMPKLAPLMPKESVSVDAPLPNPVEFRTALPKLIPIDKAYGNLGESIATRTAPPKLIPINEAYGNLGEPIWEEGLDAKDGMPNIMDFL